MRIKEMCKSLAMVLVVCAALLSHGAPVVLVSDDFSSGSGTLGTINGWEGAGPEIKNYNVASSGVLEWNHTSGTTFDSVALAFTSQALVNTGDSISVSFDYQTLGTVDNNTGFRLRLYERGSTLFSSDAHGYGVNVPSGTSTANISYRDIVSAAPFGTGTDGVTASSGSALGNGGSFVFTVTKTGANEVTLGGSNSVRGVFNPDVRSSTFTNFDAFGVTVGSITHGLQIDNVQVTFTLGIANDPPAFSADPFLAPPATEYVPYSGSVAGMATDPDGDPLTYSKVDGPAWLNVAADGSLSGAPTGADDGLNTFTVSVTDGKSGSDTATLEITVLDGGSRTAFSDDFSSGSGTLGSINGWTEQGPEDKDYNIGASGMLVLQDANGDEKGTGAHAGYFDNIYADLGGTVSLPNVGDWIRLSIDFDVFAGSWSGAAVADDTQGLRISLTESGLSTNAGYGLYIATGNQTTHGYKEMKVVASSQASIGDALTGVDISENAALKNLTLLLSRVDGGVELSGSLDGNTLATVTNSNAAIIDNLFDTLTFSVASRDHGLKIDNVEVTVPNTSTLWNQFVSAKTAGTEPVLPDFSYAGYHHGEEPIPTAGWDIFNVTSYGAVADDGLSDKAAIKAAVAAAEANGSGIIFFPPGRFEINKPETPWTNDPIYVEGSRIVFRGSGSGPGGTELYAERHMDPTVPTNFWTCPYMIYFKGYGDRPGTASDVVADARRETHVVTVADASIFEVGDWVQLHRLDNSPSAVAEAVAPYAVDPLWTSIIDNGVAVDEHHLIASIAGNDITFKEPIHADVASGGNWSVVLFDPLEEVGVEDIGFTGNWISNFVHHASFYDDSGWSALRFVSTVNSWIRNCRFTDWSVAMSVADSAAVTVSDIKLDGNPGHNALTFNNSSHCFAGMIDDQANHWHACGVAGKCSGNVFWKSEYSADTCFESHASQPRHTLFDNITGGWMYGRWGGSLNNQPNHLENLVFWNYKNIGAGEPGLYEFMRSGSLYGRIIMPYVIGFHGNPQSFDESMIAVLESNGTAVEPASLYEAQYKMRMGRPLTQLFYDEWIVGYGLAGPDADYLGDPDSDLRANLAEYAIGGIPSLGSNSPSELLGGAFITDGGFSGVEYIHWRRRNAAALGLTYTVEFTDNLMSNSWSVAGVSETGTAVVDSDFESVTNRVSAAGKTNGFVRLRIGIDQ